VIIMAEIIRELDTVCSDCLYIVAYSVESEEQAKLFESWPEWARNTFYLVVACSDDECDHGFTWSPCDLCGQTGIEPHNVVQFA
jgi:hypothetical protein